MKKVFIAAICAIAFCTVSPNILNAQVNHQDSIALVDLYNSTNGPGWYDHTNWLTNAPVATWFGIGVKGNRVDFIQLYENNLNGKIPVSFGKLTSVTYIVLSYNNLTDTLPSSFGNLINLHVLGLEGNKFKGAIPSSFKQLISLTSLELGNNQFSGNVQSILSKLTKITYLSLGANKFSGNISFLDKMPALTYAALSSNKFNGEIPVLGNLNNIGYLELSNNQFSGSIPKFHKGGKLLYLNLSNNQLGGKLTNQFDSLTNTGLDVFIAHNNLSGKIPSLKRSSLHGLDVSFNQLSDSLPEIDSLSSLKFIDFSHNRLTGGIPSSFNKANHLKGLDLSFNQLSGKIPPLNNLLQLYILNIGSNQFTFAGMEDLTTDFSFAKYAPQAAISINQNANVLYVSAGGNKHNTYKWYRNGELYKIITGNDRLAVNKAGNYSVAVTNSVATQLTLYSDTVYLYYSVHNENLIAADFNKALPAFVYPNPVKTDATLCFYAEGKYTMEITDLSGRILKTKTGIAATYVNNMHLDLSNYSAGIYFITVADETQHTQKVKLIKE